MKNYLFNPKFCKGTRQMTTAEAEDSVTDTPAFKTAANWAEPDPDDADYTLFDELKARLKFPLTLYRAVSIPGLHRLNTEQIGVCWTTEERFAVPYDGNQSRHATVLRAQVNEDAIDWDATFFINVEMRWSESEIRLKEGANIILTGIRSGGDPEWKEPETRRITATDPNRPGFLFPEMEPDLQGQWHPPGQSEPEPDTRSLEERLDEAEGNKVAVERILHDAEAWEALTYPGGKLYRADEAVIDVSDNGAILFYNDPTQFVQTCNIEEFYPNAEEEFNEEFWKYPPELYHATQEENIPLIMKDGLNTGHKTRGISNRGVGSALFTSESMEYLLDGSYGDAILRIDMAAFKESVGELPIVAREPDVQEGNLRKRLAHALDLQDYEYDYESGMDAETVIVYGAIPPQFLHVEQGGMDTKTSSDKAAATTSNAAEVQKLPGTGEINLWHGGRISGQIELQNPTKGRYEAGPGLYLTTSYERAYSYAKGGGSTFLVTLKPNLAWADETPIPLADGVDFAKRYLGNKAKDIIADLQRNCSRMKKDSFTADIIINLVVNYEAGAGKKGLALAKFLVEHGVDAALENKSGDEQWVVVFNPRVVVKTKKVPAAEVTSDMWHLPKVGAVKRYYHGTSSENLNSIAQRGLITGRETNWGGELGVHSEGKVFLASDPETAMFYAEVIFQGRMSNGDELACIPVCLRVTPPTSIKVTQDTDELWTSQPIPPQYIEVWWQGQWSKLKVGEWDELTCSIEDGKYVDWEGEPLGSNLTQMMKSIRQFTRPKIASKTAATLDSHAFLSWFSDSKVVDKQGNPRQVYHGTDAHFKEFSTEGVGKTEGTGAFFTSDSSNARAYGRNIRHTYLKITHPLEVYCNNKGWDRLSSKMNTSEGNLFDWMEIGPEDDIDFITSDDVASHARSSDKFDGVIFYKMRDQGPGGDDFKSQDIFVIFNPNQVKTVSNVTAALSSDDQANKYPSLKDICVSMGGIHNYAAAAADELVPPEVPPTPVTPEFWSWFGSSKVVNEDWSPRVVYHGSRSPWLTQFDLQYEGSGSVSRAKNGAMWFTSERDNASWFADYKDKFEADTQNITVYGDKDKWYAAVTSLEHDEGEETLFSVGPYPTYEEAEEDAIKEAEQYNAALHLDTFVTAAYLRIENPYITNVVPRAKEFDAARKGGHDGIIAKDVADGIMFSDIFVVFNPSQIKSATRNSGTYSRGTNSIVSSFKNPLLKKAQTIGPVYHGTTYDFDDFKRNKGLRSGFLGMTLETDVFAYFFTKDKGQAVAYAKNRQLHTKQPARLITAYLTINNMLDLTNPNWVTHPINTPPLPLHKAEPGADPDDIYEEHADELNSSTGVLDYLVNYLLVDEMTSTEWGDLAIDDGRDNWGRKKREPQLEEGFRAYDLFDNKKVSDALRYLGFDGAKVPEGDDSEFGGESYCVFSSNQVKIQSNVELGGKRASWEEDELPPAPGTAPIPPMTVRLYHYTKS